MIILLLPGLHGTETLFWRIVPELSRHFTVEVRQYPNAPFLTYQEIVEYLAPTLPDQCCLVAESYAGPLAVLLGASYPEKIQGIVFSGSFLRSPVKPWLKFLAFGASPLLWALAHMPTAIFDWAAHNTGAYQWLIGSREDPELLQQLRRIVRTSSPQLLLKRALDILRTDVSDPFTQLQCPLLYLAGSEDKVVHKRNAVYMEKLQPGMNIIEIPSSHLVLQEEPRKVAKEIEKFIRGDQQKI